MRKLPWYYTKSQHQAFMATVQNRNHSRIFEILFGSGCRIAEIIGQEKKRCITCTRFCRKDAGWQGRNRAPGIPWCSTQNMRLPKPPSKHVCPQFRARFPGLQVEQVDLENSTIRLTGKGDVERVIAISSKAIRALKEVIGDRKSGRIDFGIGIRRVEQLALYYANKAKLPDIEKYGRWSPHKMRHTHLTFLVEAAREMGQNEAILLAKEQAGHRSIETTEIYLHTTGIEARRRAVDKTDL